MGEVYRARDSRLNRDVALKVVPASLSHDPERMARFTREAQVLASLNHPHIAAIYGVEDEALVMELVEGPTLDEHLARGPLPIDEALELAGQIAEALEYAHERGVVHRDLKPANVKLTADGAVKVLDFGLAKALGDPAAEGSGSIENSPTVHATATGLILGTAAYMAPEQARGLKVDRRADIWSFGVVLYEMLTGRRPFVGATSGDVLAAVLRADIDWTPVPARCQRLLRRCLERDPRQRLREIGDWRLLLDDSSVTMAPPGGRSPSASRAWQVASAILLVAAAGFAWTAWRASIPVSRPLVRLDVNLGPDLIGHTAGSPAVGDLSLAVLSPDGTRLAYSVQTRDGHRQVATRLLEQDGASVIPGTEGGSDPFFSPDGQFIAFVADNRLKKVPVQGGAVVTLYAMGNTNE
jgi:serine/threonine-protein kinase